MPSITVNGSVMHYLEQGKGRALVLVHGFPLDSRMWEAQVAGTRIEICSLRPRRNMRASLAVGLACKAPLSCY